MRMIRKSFFIVCLFLNLILFSSEDYQEWFAAQKTLTKQINRFQDYVNTSLEALEAANMKQLEELKHRVETLDSVKISNLVQTIDTLRTFVSTIYSKIDQLARRLQTRQSIKTAELKQLKLRIEAVARAKVLKLLQFKQRPEEFERVLRLKFPKIKHRLKFLEAKNEILRYLIQPRLPRNCGEVKERGYNISTTYRIKPDSAPKAIEVLCDLEKRGGGWTYILNRFDGSQNFDFDMEEYKNGFGKLSSEFWLGLDNIHHLTGYKVNELLVELVDWNDTSVFAHYDRFRVGSGDEDYKMIIIGYSGTAGDSFSSKSNNTKFSTQKNDLDNWLLGSCAVRFGASWWYNDCTSCLLTGTYLKSGLDISEESKIMHWSTFRGDQYNLKEARMMVRPRI